MLILLILLILVIPGIKYKKSKEYTFEEVLNKETCNVLKGFLAIFIMSGHIIKTKELNHILLFFIDKGGTLAVGIFFFLSGFGVMYSFSNKKEKYLNLFLRKRFVSVVTPFLVIYILQSIIFGFLNIESISWYILKGYLNNWFVVVILIMYFLFYIGMKYIPDKYNIAFLFLSTCIIMLSAYFIGLSHVYWGSYLCFSVGVYFGNDAEAVAMCIKTHWIKLFLVAFSLLIIGVLLYIKIGTNTFGGDLLGRNIATIAIPILMVIFLYLFKIGNFASFFLGKIYYEIYLLHPLFLYLLKDSNLNITNDNLYIILVMSFTIIASMLVHLINKNIVLYFNRKCSVQC